MFQLALDLYQTKRTETSPTQVSKRFSSSPTLTFCIQHLEYYISQMSKRETFAKVDIPLDESCEDEKMHAGMAISRIR